MSDGRADEIVPERKKMGNVQCENCGAACNVYEANKTGRLSYSCHECGTQMFARTHESMSKLMERINKKDETEVDHDGQEKAGGLDWDW